MRRKIDFLDRLFEKLKCRIDILQFLKDEHLITDDQMQTILHEQHNQHSTKIAMLLEELRVADKLQLVDYEWSILPKELLCLTLVSAEGKREFSYSV